MIMKAMNDDAAYQTDQRVAADNIDHSGFDCHPKHLGLLDRLCNEVISRVVVKKGNKPVIGTCIRAISIGTHWLAKKHRPILHSMFIEKDQVIDYAECWTVERGARETFNDARDVMIQAIVFAMPNIGKIPWRGRYLIHEDQLQAIKISGCRNLRLSGGSISSTFITDLATWPWRPTQPSNTSLFIGTLSSTKPRITLGVFLPSSGYTLASYQFASRFQETSLLEMPCLCHKILTLAEQC